MSEFDTDISNIEADLAAAATAVAEAEARLAAAEEARERAAAEDEERRRREEDDRVATLREELPRYDELAAEALAQFQATASGRSSEPLSRSLERWAVVVAYRALCDRMRHRVLSHDATRSTEAYAHWERKTGEWQELIRGATCVAHGGHLPGEEDDLEALAEVNALIVEESASAPRPLRRDPREQSLPGPETLGVPDPVHARMTLQYEANKYAPVPFGTAFDEAVRIRAEEDARALVPPPGATRRTQPDPESNRPLTRDEKVATALAETLRNHRRQ